MFLMIEPEFSMLKHPYTGPKGVFDKETLAFYR